MCDKLAEAKMQMRKIFQEYRKKTGFKWSQIDNDECDQLVELLIDAAVEKAVEKVADQMRRRSY